MSRDYLGSRKRTEYAGGDVSVVSNGFKSCKSTKMLHSLGRGRNSMYMKLYKQEQEVKKKVEELKAKVR